MKNRLFLVCPFSNMETFIRRKFKQDVYFLTAMAGHVPFHELKFTEAVVEIIKREKITELYLVNDISCRFMRAVLEGEPLHDTPAEKKLEQLFVNHYDELMQQPTLSARLKAFAALNIRVQLQEMGNNAYWSAFVKEYRLEIKGLITTKAEEELVEIQQNVYEL
jgi:carbonic anhydrase